MANEEMNIIKEMPSLHLNEIAFTGIDMVIPCSL